jgi:uncharacterized protein
LDAQPITIVMTRRVRREDLGAFERAVCAWVPRALEFPGHLGALRVRPSAEGDEHGVVLRFRSREDWDAFRRWEPYRAFLDGIAPMLVDAPRVTEAHGLESWMESGGNGHPIRWRMALVTFIAVNALVFGAMRLVAWVGPEWPSWIGFLVTNGIVVSMLAWVVMPVATRWLRVWLVGGTS